MRAALLTLLVATLSVGTTGARIAVVTGESMSPSIRAGDTVLTAMPSTLSEIHAGSILLYEQNGQQFLHRVVSVSGTHLWMKGDASRDGDTQPVELAEVRGGLFAVIPTSLILQSVQAAAGFTQRLNLDLSLTGAPGSSMDLETTKLTAADSQGRLSAGSYVTWSLLLYGCIAAPAQCTSSYSLKISAAQFSSQLPSIGSVGSPSQSLARSLRINTRCRAAALTSGAWTDMGDLLTVEWDAQSQATGLLATYGPTSVTAGVRCEVKATLLNVVPAAGGSMSLPLAWGPA
jgi:hypothetical protein